MKKLIFIYGVSGSGKTYISRRISADLKLPLFEADTLKDGLRKLTTKEESPFLFSSTGQAYRYFGELNKDNVIKGLRAVREALAESVSKEIKGHNEVIMEGAFLDPNSLKDLGKLILVITSDEERHRKQFFQHREESENNMDEFRSVRIIQDFLINEARDLGVEVKENE